MEYVIILCSKAKQKCSEGQPAKHIMAWDFPDPKLGASDKAYDTTMHELSEHQNVCVAARQTAFS